MRGPGPTPLQLFSADYAGVRRQRSPNAGSRVKREKGQNRVANAAHHWAHVEDHVDCRHTDAHRHPQTEAAPDAMLLVSMSPGTLA